MDAIYAEIKGLIINYSWDMLKRTKDKVVGIRIVLPNKYKPDGTLEKRKARAVAQRLSQRYGIDYQDIIASVARLDSLRLLVAFSAEFNIEIAQTA